MRIIDLLNKIANDEEVPEIIRYEDEIFKAIYEDDGHSFYGGLLNVINDTSQLTDEIEILETIKEKGNIKKINVERRGYDLSEFSDDYRSAAYMLKDMGERSRLLINKVNELVNEINKIEENMDI